MDALDDAPAHEPRRAQSHPALVHAAAQRQPVDERLHVGHPRLHRQLGHTEHAADAGRERALAVLAVPALIALYRLAVALDGDGAATRASIRRQLL